MTHLSPALRRLPLSKFRAGLMAVLGLAVFVPKGEARTVQPHQFRVQITNRWALEPSLPKSIDELMKQPGAQTFQMRPTNSSPQFLSFRVPGAFETSKNQRPITTDGALDLGGFLWSQGGGDWRVGIRLKEGSGGGGSLLQLQALMQNGGTTERFYFGYGREYPIEFFVVTPERKSLRLDDSLEERRASYLGLIGYKIAAGNEAYFDITFANLDWMTVPGDYLIYGVLRIPRGHKQDEAEIHSESLLLKVTAADVAAAWISRRLRYTFVNVDPRSNLNEFTSVPERMLLPPLAAAGHLASAGDAAGDGGGINHSPKPIHTRSPMTAAHETSSSTSAGARMTLSRNTLFGLGMPLTLILGTIAWLLWRRRGTVSTSKNG